MCNPAMFSFIEPLLAHQTFIESLIYTEEAKIPTSAIDFDVIRYGSINTSAGNIKDYYFKAFGLLCNDISPWIRPDGAGRRCGEFDIVIGCSTRYLNQAIDYSLLAKAGVRIGFIGTDREFGLFQQQYPMIACIRAQVRSALDACNVIASASLYLGNQSFFFALAEALQADRLLEVCEKIPNVVPTGGR